MISRVCPKPGCLLLAVLTEREGEGGQGGGSVRSPACGWVLPAGGFRTRSPGVPAAGGAAAMGLCCCKDWRGHLRAPKGNSPARTCAVGWGSLHCATVRVPPTFSSCGWVLAALPPPGLGRPTPASALETAQVWQQVPESQNFGACVQRLLLLCGAD